MADLFDLNGKRALITGGGSGLGFAMAGGLGAAGASVILNGRNREKLEKAAAQLQSSGIEATTALFDITAEEAAGPGVKALLEEGSIDILVNNAGIQKRSPLLEMSLEDFQAVLQTNLTAAFLMGRLVAPGMIKNGGGKIINICSLMSDLARPSTGNYAAAKGGLRMLTRAMCGEWAGHNLQVNAIGPGYFATAMTQPLVDNPEFNQWICSRTPSGRWGKPEELAGIAVFLASPASSYINGQIVYVDGGLSAVI